jgi:hypothetical protein
LCLEISLLFFCCIVLPCIFVAVLYRQARRRGGLVSHFLEMRFIKMLYLTEKSSAPATVRRSTSARIAARARRIARRSAARVYRAARIADTHTAPAAVLITPITPY